MPDAAPTGDKAGREARTIGALTPELVALLRPIRDVMGSWGQTEPISFTRVTCAGTVNQARRRAHAAAVRAMLAVIRAARR